MNRIACSRVSWLAIALLVAGLVVAGAVPGAGNSDARAEAPGGSPELVEVHALGAAPAGDTARNQALDRAFRYAVEKVVTQLIGTSALRKHRGVVRAKILRHARRFVASFRVRSTDMLEGRVRVRILARVRRGGLQRALRTLGIARSVGTAGPAPVSLAAARPSVALILHARRPGGAVATFGSAAGAGGAAGKELARSFDDMGFARVSLAGKSVPTSTSVPTGVPLSDAAGVALARSAGAGIAVVVGVDTSPQGRIRGTRLVGAVARLRVRVLDVPSGRLVSRGEVRAGGFAPTAAVAQRNAGREAARRAVLRVASDIQSRWPAVPDVKAAALISVRGVVGWASVAALLEGLRTTPGVARAGLERLSRADVLIAVEATLSPAQIVTAVRGVTLPIGSAVVSGPAGKLVHVKLAGQTPAAVP